MASSPSPMAYLFLLFLSYLPITTLSQNPGTSPNSPSITECGSHLLPLVPCAPFVQGSVPMPAQQCCDNLKQVYTQQPTCLCFVLNNTNLSSFPINTTLALQLPQICNLKVDFSTCLGGPPPSTQPASQVSFGARNGSTVGASPVVTVAPRPTIMGHGIQRNNGGSLKIADHLMVVVVAALLSIALF